MIGERLKELFFSAYCLKHIISFVEYLMLDFLYSGGYAFYLFELLYIISFNFTHRQKNKQQINSEANHWEDPEVYGLNRREAHVPLKSFANSKSAVEYWMNGGGPSNSHLLPNIRLLTGAPGSPEGSEPWKFLLKGEPKASPTKWELVLYAYFFK